MSTEIKSPSAAALRAANYLNDQGLLHNEWMLDEHKIPDAKQVEHIATIIDREMGVNELSEVYHNIKNGLSGATAGRVWIELTNEQYSQALQALSKHKTQ